MGRVWFTSDLHLGHAKVAELRGFASTKEHDQALVDNWRSVVNPKADDQVWVLGDIATSSPGYALDVIHALPGTKHLILGNHDAAHPMHRNAHHKLRQYLWAFESVAMAARRRVEGEEVLLSHFPYRRDRNEARHNQWRLRDEGLPLLHGHTHGEERLTVDSGLLGLLGRKTTELHVGLDAWEMQLVPLEAVAHALYLAREVAA
jgi:calcineurin-like phosphoesterase family protein